MTIVTRIGIEAVAEGAFVAVERSHEGFWQVAGAPQTETSQGMIEAAASQVTALRLLAEGLSLSPVDVGLGEPAYIVSVSFSDDAEYVFRTGDLTPSGRGYYIQSKNGEIAIVDSDGLDALVKLIELVH